MPDPLRARPPERALRWAAAAVGPGARVVSLQRLTLGGWNANHALAVADREGTVHRLVLRRWARPGWSDDDPGFTVERERRVLGRVADAPVPTPRVLAADPEAASCDVPALLMTRLPGRAPGLPRDPDAFLAQLAGALPAIHAVAPDALSAYERYHDLSALDPPAWSRRPELWARAIELVGAEPPPAPAVLIHRDYHPENTLWWRGRLTGVVDWTSGCAGPAAVDVGHMRWNLAVTYGLDAADAFLARYRALVPAAADDQRYWDLVCVLDVLPEAVAGDWPAFALARLERHLAHALDD